MQSDLTHWHYLSPWAVAFLLIRGGSRFARENIPILLGAGAGVALFERVGVREVALFAVVLVLASVLFAFAYYRRFRFRMEEDVLLVQRGLLQRTELKVAAGRVQQIGLQQPFYFRPLGIVRFVAETPGGGSAEVELPGIRRDLAESLRRSLSGDEEQGQPAFDPASGAAEAAPELIHMATAKGVTLHGLTSNAAYVFLAMIAPLVPAVERVSRHTLADGESATWLTGLLVSPWLVAIVLVVAFPALIVTLSVVGAWLRFHGFRLTFEKGRYVQRSGLLNRHEQILSADRLQVVESVETLPGRLLRRRYLICRQIGSPARGGEHSARAFLVPGLTRRRADELVATLWECAPLVGALQQVDRRFARACAFRFALGGALLLGLATLLALDWRWLIGLVLLPLPALLYGRLRWLAVGWRIEGGVAEVRNGLLGRRSLVFPLDRVQGVQIRQSWWQRRRGLATVRLGLAGGSAVVPWLPLTQARGLANLTVARIEFGEDGTDRLAHRISQGIPDRTEEQQ